MKKMHIVGLIVIAAAIGILITQVGEFDTYGNFTTASTELDRTHSIVGNLVTGDEYPINYKPEIDPNSFSFYMKDKEGTIRQVQCEIAKPQDFERSEEIVLKGKMQGDLFKAHDIQLKCPSKYQDQALQNSSEVVSK